MSEKETTKAAVTAKRKKKGIEITLSFQLKDTLYGIIRKTRKERGNEITEFRNYTAGFNFIGITAVLSPLFIFLKNPSKGLTKLKKKAFSDLLRIPQYNEVVTPTIMLCADEFEIFMSELQAGAYSGAARTLRCILETAVEACEFQTDGHRPTGKTLMNEFAPLFASRKKTKDATAFMIRHNAWAAFLERYQTYEKSKRIAPTFKELVNDLNSRQLFSEAPQISDELKCIYEILSDHVHPSSMKFEKAISGKRRLGPRFNHKDFDTILELGKRTLDAVQFLYIVTIAHFLEFKTGREFLKEIAGTNKVPSFSFVSLPFSKRISRGITWKTPEETKT